MKTKTILFLFMISLFMLIVGIGCEDAKLKVPSEEQPSQQATTRQAGAAIWDFPVKPGTEEWKSLETIEQQYEAYNIPESLMKEISTDDLVKICLDYPEWGLIYAFNDPQTGFAHVLDLFNGFEELFSRKDAAKELIKVYLEMNPLEVSQLSTDLDKGLFSFQFTCIEMLMSTNPIISLLDDEDKRLLLQEGITKYKSKEQFPDVYCLWSLSPTAHLCLSIIESDGRISEDIGRRSLKRRALYHDKSVLDEIIVESENFLKQ